MSGRGAARCRVARPREKGGTGTGWNLDGGGGGIALNGWVQIGPSTRRT
jgi:hypothetical protein